MSGKKAAEIPSIKRARREIKIVFARWPRCLEPATEVAGVVGEGAYVLCADIEQMVRIARRIGEAAADLLARLDHSQPEAPVPVSEQMSGHQGAARAGPDNGDFQGARLGHDSQNPSG